LNTKNFCEKHGIERFGTNCLKWDALDVRFGDPDLISMWVADMEFTVADVIRDALIKRVEHGVYGYSYIPEDYYESVIDWQKKLHGNTLEKEWFRFSTGVVVALYWFVNAFTEPDDAVMIITPVYYPFHNAVKDTGRKLVRHQLVNTDGYYTFDFELFEKDIVENDVKMIIESSPHNPVGRVWTEEELDMMLSICKKHNVLVISDEIHQDVIVGDKKFIPAFAVKDGAYLDTVITVTSASKTFNLAGLLHSHIFIADEKIRERYDAYAKTVNQTEVNIMGCVATQAAYDGGGEWLTSVLNIVRENDKYLRSEFAREIPKVIVSPLEGTYLLWVDMRAYLGTEGIKEFIQDKCRLAIDYGEWFCPDAKGFIRFNLATEPRYVENAVKNIIKCIKEMD